MRSCWEAYALHAALHPFIMQSWPTEVRHNSDACCARHVALFKKHTAVSSRHFCSHSSLSRIFIFAACAVQVCTHDFLRRPSGQNRAFVQVSLSLTSKSLTQALPQHNQK